MLMLSWWQVVLYAALLWWGGLCAGIALVWWCQSLQAAERGLNWHRRTAREWDDSRYREGSSLDGQWRGVRWLPTEEEER
jgi:hypothetical protein